jgi:hypothetical protein
MLSAVELLGNDLNSHAYFRDEIIFFLYSVKRPKAEKSGGFHHVLYFQYKRQMPEMQQHEFHQRRGPIGDGAGEMQQMRQSHHGR